MKLFDRMDELTRNVSAKHEKLESRVTNDIDMLEGKLLELRNANVAR